MRGALSATSVGAEPSGGLHTYYSDMARNFWGALWAWVACFVVTIGVSLVTRPRSNEDMKGLVWSLTPRVREHGLAWYLRPGILAVIVGAMAIALNVVFW